MPSQKRSLDEPAIRALLGGLKRGNKRYYRADPITAVPMVFPARAELMKLAGMSQATGSRLLREAVEAGLIEVGFVRNEEISARDETDKIPEVSPDDEEDDNGETEESTNRYHRSPMGYGNIEPGQIHRYQLVKQGDWYGYWDDEYGYQQLVSRSKEETLERIYQLQRKGCDESLWYGNTGKI